MKQTIAVSAVRPAAYRAGAIVLAAMAVMLSGAEEPKPKPKVKPVPEHSLEGTWYVNWNDPHAPRLDFLPSGKVRCDGKIVEGMTWKKDGTITGSLKSMPNSKVYWFTRNRIMLLAPLPPEMAEDLGGDYQAVDLWRADPLPVHALKPISEPDPALPGTSPVEPPKPDGGSPDAEVLPRLEQTPGGVAAKADNR
jgi:hypothetical protein